MNSDRKYYFIHRMTNVAKKEKRRRNSFCKPAKSIAMGLSRVFIGFYTSSSYECIRMYWMQICKHELFVCLGWQSLDIIRHADTRTRGHALNIISEIKLSISLVLISFAINAIGFVSCLPIINESTTHPFPSLSLSHSLSADHIHLQLIWRIRTLAVPVLISCAAPASTFAWAVTVTTELQQQLSVPTMSTASLASWSPPATPRATVFLARDRRLFPIIYLSCAIWIFMHFEAASREYFATK